LDGCDHHCLGFGRGSIFTGGCFEPNPAARADRPEPPVEVGWWEFPKIEHDLHCITVALWGGPPQATGI